MISNDLASLTFSGEVFPSVASGNCNSLSITKAGGVSGRFFKIITYISYLVNNHKIVCLQDTRFPTDDFVNNLQPFFPNYLIVSSADTEETSGGLITIIHPSLLDKYEVDNHIISKGAVLLTTLTHKTNNANHNIVNCYLDASNEPRWCQQVKHIHDYNIPSNTIMVGDFNHVYDPQDRSGPHKDHNNNSAKLYQSMLHIHNFQQVEQPTHTWYGYRSCDDLLSSSKVDRIYHNFSYLQLAGNTPQASVISTTPYSIAQYGYKNNYHEHDDCRVIDYYLRKIDGGTHITDHVPVSVRFNTQHNKHTPKFRSFTLNHDDFMEEFEHIWSANTHKHNCFDILDDYKRILIHTSDAIRKKPKTAPSKDTALWDAVKLANEIGSTDTNTLKTKYSHIPNYICLIDTPDDLINEINENFAARAFDSAEHTPISKIQTIAKCLPANKERILHLFDEGSEAITDDPDRMTKIIHNFWGDKWKGKRVKNPKAFFEAYGKKVKTPPPNVNLHNVTEGILNTNDSSPGPDGIPFAAFRKTVDFVAPILLDCIRWLMQGHQAPEGFNGGILHLLPKKNTGRVEDTRPLVINNCDNRIIATIVRDAIVLPIESILSNNQNGFREHRSTAINLEYFNEKFYRALEHEKFYDILLIDFCKAFDSIAHEAIFALVAEIGLGEDYVNIIKALFSNAHCYTNIKGADPLRIDFGSGVKQGCPLSPLLFILITDVLIDMLEEIDVDVKFFADDAGVGDPNIIPKLPMLKKCFQVFKNYTGLEMNVTKTVCIATGGRNSLISALKDIGWEATAVVGKVKYLGLYMGQKATLDDIFREPYEKMTARLHSYNSIKKKFSLPKRVLIWNTWILPIFSYVFNFYTIPSDYSSWIDKACNDWLSNGNTIKSLHLTRPTSLLGLQAPLRDSCNHNYARLTALSTPGRKDPRSPTWSMRYTTHRSIARDHVIQQYGVSPDKHNDSASIYKAISVSSVMTAEYLPYIRQKIGRMGIVSAYQRTYINNYRKTPSWVPCYARFNNLSITHNILPTARRHQEHRVCYLCNDHEDSVQHIYGHCRVAKEAYNNIWSMANSNYKPFSLLSSVCANTSRTKAEIGLQIMLADSTWRARCNAKYGNKRDADGWISWITTDTMGRVRNFSPAFFSNQLNGNNFPNRYKISIKANLGSSSNTSAATVNVANVTRKHIASLPIDTHFAFTDGSARPNPGPAGAGAVILQKSSIDTQTHKHSYTAAIGNATNNTGELYAIGMVVEHCDAHNVCGEVHIYTDSKISKGAITNGWSAGNANKGILYRLREKMHKIRDRTKFIIHWIPGHSGISENDIADNLANAGALYSNNNRIHNIDIDKDIDNNGFLGLVVG